MDWAAPLIGVPNDVQLPQVHHPIFPKENHDSLIVWTEPSVPTAKSSSLPFDESTAMELAWSVWFEKTGASGLQAVPAQPPDPTPVRTSD